MVNTIRDILIVGLSMAAQVRGFAPASTHRPRSHQSRPREVAPVEIGEVSDTMLMTGGAAAAIVATHPLWLKALGLKKPSDGENSGYDDVEEKSEVREYFNKVGFERWNKIYSESDEVNKVQLDIRDGHQETIDTVLEWVDEDKATVQGKSYCDLGCGVGSLAIPLAQRGATVSASDISSSMASEAARRAKELGVETASFEASDLESVSGSYDTVTCIDVMIHYPTEKMSDMVKHVASLSSDRVLVSFAPKTPQYVLLTKLGELFPGPSKTPRAYLHPEQSVRTALQEAGFEVKRSKLTATNFYFSTLLEAQKV